METRLDKKRTEYVEALGRGLAVIEAFDSEHSEMTLTEVALRTGLKPATARRSLLTLVELGYALCVNKRFLLAPHILTLGSAYLRSAHIDEVLTPELQRLVGRFGDAASVSILYGRDILYIAHYSVQRVVRPMAGIGMTYPAYATSMGRVLLASLPTPEIDSYLETAKLEKLTDFTRTDRKALRDVILNARKLRYATAIDELAYGVASLAVPIEAPRGHVIAALNTSGYSGRLTEEALIQERLTDLQASAAQIASILNRYPALLHSISAPAGPGRIRSVIAD